MHGIETDLIRSRSYENFFVLDGVSFEVDFCKGGGMNFVDDSSINFPNVGVAVLSGDGV